MLRTTVGTRDLIINKETPTFVQGERQKQWDALTSHRAVSGRAGTAVKGTHASLFPQGPMETLLDVQLPGLQRTLPATLLLGNFP